MGTIVFFIEVFHLFGKDDSLVVNFLGGTINGIIFLISFLMGSLIVYRNPTDFCVFTWYPATLINLCVSSKGLLFELYVLQARTVDFFLSCFILTMFFLPDFSCYTFEYYVEHAHMGFL